MNNRQARDWGLGYARSVGIRVCKASNYVEQGPAHALIMRLVKRRFQHCGISRQAIHPFKQRRKRLSSKTDRGATRVHDPHQAMRTRSGFGLLIDRMTVWPGRPSARNAALDQVSCGGRMPWAECRGPRRASFMPAAFRIRLNCIRGGPCPAARTPCRASQMAMVPFPRRGRSGLGTNADPASESCRSPGLSRERERRDGESGKYGRRSGNIRGAC